MFVKHNKVFGKFNHKRITKNEIQRNNKMQRNTKFLH